ncbi:MAG: gamma-glutamyltransferase [Alphaproteobacteria bacterium]|nr:gamma-glutamyltransferase [Alphaproteobacteria bacterium]
MNDRRKNFFARARFLPVLACAALALAACEDQFGLTTSPSAIPPRPATAGEISAERFAVSASHPQAALAARDVLKKGGTAMDAAVAAALVMGVVEPQASGLGGGAYLLYYDAGKKALHALDGRETAPASAKADLFLDRDGKSAPFNAAARGGKPVGVPGLVRLMADAHKAHGKLPWKDLFAPAIVLAENGFEVSERLHETIAEAAGDLKASREAAALYLDDKGNARPKGHLLKNPALAGTLKTIAEKGPDGFYAGPVAEAIQKSVGGAHHNPAAMAAADLAGYRVKAREPVCATYRAHKICSMPPSSSGGLALLQILGTLAPFELHKEKPFSADAVHLISEASRLAFADREVYTGDPDFVPVPLKGLLAPDYLADRSKSISRARAMRSPSPGMPAMSAADATRFAVRTAAPQEEGDSTAHVSIADAAGNVVSLTASIERIFGARIVAAGFVLNNQLTDFAFQPTRQGGAVANAPQASKRPRSSMTPAVVFDAQDRPVLAVGSPGGPRIIGYVAKTVIAVLDWGMSPGDAVRAPNVLDRGRGIEIEKGTPLEPLKTAMEGKGHGVGIHKMDSGTNIVAVKYGLGAARTLTAVADPRREGAAAGE